MLALRTCCVSCLAVLCMLIMHATCTVGEKNGNDGTNNRATNIPATQNDPLDDGADRKSFEARTDSLTSIALLEEFLDLHVKACGQVQLCTLKTEPTSAWPPDNNPTACCRACSCNDGCRRNGNCCPDYQFFKTAGNVTFDNVTQLLAAVENTEMNGESMFKATSQSVNMNGECIRLQVASVESIGPRGRDYIMITSCLNEYTNMTVSDQCQHPDSSFYHNVPVYSKHTEKSYKNSNCALCNDVEAADLTYWQPILLVKYLSYEGTHYDDPDALLEHVKTTRSRNLVFEPNDPSIKTESCTLVTKDTCPESETSQVEETRKLREMCERFYLPVDGVHMQRQTFRNIACYRCDAVTKYASKFCFSPSQRWPVFSAYIYMSKPRPSRSEETLRRVFDESGRCDQGYALDIDTGVCRKVLCPRNFYIANGRCRPMFNKIVGPRYRTMMRMELTQETRRTNTSEQLVQLISDFLSHVLTETTKLANFSFALYEKPNDYYIIILNFSFENNVSYLQELLGMVEEIVKRLSSHPMVKAVGIYSTSFANTMPTMTVYDLQTKSKLVPWIPASADGSTFISGLDFCYRKRLNPGEIKITMFYSVIKASGNKIANVDQDTTDDGHHVVCIDNLAQPPHDIANSPLPPLDNANSPLPNGAKSADKSISKTVVPWEENNGDSDAAWSSVEKGLLAIGIMLILLLICIILRKTLKHTLSPFQPSSPI